jgi:hypothetical protein
MILLESTSAQQDEETIGSFDLEDGEEGFQHGGINDTWEWGIPGPGPEDNPGPGGTGEDIGCFGTSLNGTYGLSEMSYLQVPDLNTAQFRYLSLEYRIWFDLSPQEDERNGTGTEIIADHLLVQVRTPDDNWNTVANHSGSSDGDWINVRLDLSSFNVDILSVRFLMVDVEDGLVDNGAFIDIVRVNGTLRPLVEIELQGSPIFHRFVPVNRSVKVHFTVMNEGRTIPTDTYVSLSVLGPEGTSPVTERTDIGIERTYRDFLEWTPSKTGVFSLSIELTVDGEIVSSYSSESTALRTVFYDGFTQGPDQWSISTPEGYSDWYPIGEQPGPPTISGGTHLRFGVEGSQDFASGFEGSTYSVLRGPEIDLSLFREAYLRIFHSYGFMGQQGSCGGLVQALDSSGEWITLEPDLPHTRILKDDISGTMEGEYAFQGDRDWYQVGFDLLPFIGAKSRIRFVISSGENGEGRGWWIDDVMVTGEGIDPDDKVPPEPIQGITVQVMGEGWVEVYWDQSFASDLDHYKVYIGSGQEPVRRSDLFAIILPENDTAITIRDLDPTIEQWVLVTAVDINGNEDRTIDPVRFTPSMETVNIAPVAEARVLGPSSGELGDVFIFNGSLSFDPDGETLTFFWELPDGSSVKGEQVRWESTISGENLIVSLVVQDTFGKAGFDNVTVTVKDPGNSDVESEDITQFLLFITPIVVTLIVIVALVAWLRGSRQKKIRRELLRMGLDTEPTATRVHAQVIESSEDETDGSPEIKVMELVPIHTTKAKPKKETKVSVAPTPKRTAAPLKESMMDHHETGKVEVPLKKGNEVNALLECPFCNNSFKARVDRSKLMSGEPFRIKCPECGRSGMIGE